MFEEVKEMIDSTVYTNGNGEVTAQNLNLAFHWVIDATEEKITEVENKVAQIEENGTGGSGALRVWIGGEDNPLTDQQIAENISTYNTMLGGENVSVILCSAADVSIDDFSLSQRTTIPVVSIAIKQSYTGEQVVTVMLVNGSNYDEPIILNPDGSVVLPEVDEPSTSYEFYIPVDNTKTLDDAFIAKNVEFYNGAAKYASFSWDNTNVKIYLVKHDGMELMFITPINTKVVDGMTFLYFEDAILKEVKLATDGSVSVEVLASTPASNGPLRVWMDEIINGSILSEKKAENARTYAAIKNGALDAMCVFEQELKSGIVYYETIRSSGIVVADTVVSIAITMEEDGTLVNYSINIGADGSTAIGA